MITRRERLDGWSQDGYMLDGGGTEAEWRLDGEWGWRLNELHLT